MLTKCICTNCAGHLEFEEENAGESIPCPHCGFKTTLFLPGQETVSAESVALARKRSLRVKLLCAVGALLVIGALGFALYRWGVPWLQDQEPAIDTNARALIVLVLALVLTPFVLLWMLFPAMLFWQLGKLIEVLQSRALSLGSLETDASDLEQEGEPTEAGDSEEV